MLCADALCANEGSLSFQAGHAERHPAETAKPQPPGIKQEQGPACLDPALLSDLPSAIALPNLHPRHVYLSFVARFHFYFCDSLPLCFCLANVSGVFRIQPKCHFTGETFQDSPQGQARYPSWGFHIT